MGDHQPDADDATPELNEFRATLCFDAPPALSAAALIEAWGREGYTCTTEDTSGIFRGFRGGTYLIIGPAVPVDRPQLPPYYPAVTRPGINWARTFFVDLKAGYEDLQRATYQVDFLFRILADSADPAVAHNEIAATLLGIHQVTPMRAVMFHALGMIVGRVNLDDYLNYANSTIDEPIRTATMLAFGAFVAQADGMVQAWTTGLGHFGQLDLYVEDERLDPFNALNTVFALGHLVVHGRRFKPNQWFTSFDLHARFAGIEWGSQPMLRVEVQDFTPAEL